MKFVPVVLCLLALSPAFRVEAQPKPVPKAKAGPPFAVAQDGNRWWLTRPDGSRFFSLGVCCVTPGTPWQDYKPDNPGYAAWQHYPDPTVWAIATAARLQSWNFTTIGGWSDYQTLQRAPDLKLCFAPVLHLGSSSGAPWRDMWDPKIIAVMDAVAKAQIIPLRDDPHLLGYYTDNEMGWWNSALFKMTLEQPPTSGQRQRLLKLLHAHYGNDWQRLVTDFVPEKANGFAALDRAGVLYLRPGHDGIRVIKQFLTLLAERYYTLTRQIVRKYDPRGLLLGDRYQSFYFPEVVRAARLGVDVVSSNLNPSWQDGSFARFYLDTLHTLTNKPVLVSEFYMTAMENGSGNRNDSSGFPVVATQRERAVNFRRTLEQLVQTPCVVGAEWFQYYDEPQHGRDDGENYDMGLVDIHDRPYLDLTQAAATLDRNALHAHAKPHGSVNEGVPPAPADPTAGWKAMTALQNWDRERGFVPPTSANPVSDLYLCWNRDAVYLGLYAVDIVEPGYYKEKRIPEEDRAELTLRFPGLTQPIQIRLGAGRAAVVSGANLEVRALSGLDHDARNIAVVRLPAALFGPQRFSAGDTVRLSATLTTHARAYRVAWSGTYRLAAETVPDSVAEQAR